MISSVTQSYTNPVKWQTSACKREAAIPPPPPPPSSSMPAACRPACHSPARQPKWLAAAIRHSLQCAAAGGCLACLTGWLACCCLFLFFSLALYVTVLFEATRIQCNDDDDGNETMRSPCCRRRQWLPLLHIVFYQVQIFLEEDVSFLHQYFTLHV